MCEYIFFTRKSSNISFYLESCWSTAVDLLLLPPLLFPLVVAAGVLLQAPQLHPLHGLQVLVHDAHGRCHNHLDGKNYSTKAAHRSTGRLSRETLATVAVLLLLRWFEPD